MTNGKRVVLYGKTKSELYRKIANYSEEAETGRMFQLVADDWWADAEPELAVSSRGNYRAAYNRAREYFDGIPIASIEPKDISTFLKAAIREHLMADKTARTQLMIVNLIFRYAVEKGELKTNPAREVQVPKKLPKGGRTVASTEDIRIIKENLQEPMGLFAFVALYTGCRRNELLALEWSDIDMNRRTIRINKALFRDVDGKMRVKPPKTEKGNRLVPILDDLYAVLLEIEPKKGLLFPNGNGEYISTPAFQRRWKHYVEVTGITCVPHQLRHTFATNIVENGVPLDTVQTWMGHAQASTTTDMYTHEREAHQLEQIKKYTELKIK